MNELTPLETNDHIPALPAEPQHSVEFVRMGRGGIEVSIGTFKGAGDLVEDAVFMRMAREITEVEGRLLAGFLFVTPEHARKVFDALVSVDSEADKVLRLTKEFMAKHTIDCAETIYQTDRVIEDATPFIESLCSVVGYPKSEEEEAAGS